MSGAAETVDLNELGDIGAEQAALAQREAAATQQVEQAASQIKGDPGSGKTKLANTIGGVILDDLFHDNGISTLVITAKSKRYSVKYPI